MEPITGEKFQTLAQVSILTKPILNFHKNINKFDINYILLEGTMNSIYSIKKEQKKILKKKKIIFIYTHLIESFFEIIYPHLDSFILITHNSDNEIDDKYSNFLNENKIKKWYSQNINFLHKKLIALPIGFANSQWKHGNLDNLNIVMNKNNIKINLLYINFSISTNKKIRYPLMEKFKNSEFSTVEKKISHLNYLENLSKHKFCLVPPGNGIDCHRTWECLYLGVIPIIINHIHNNSFDDLPILIISDWNIISYEFLNKKYLEIVKKKYNLEKIDFNYWKNQITY